MKKTKKAKHNHFRSFFSQIPIGLVLFFMVLASFLSFATYRKYGEYKTISGQIKNLEQKIEDTRQEASSLSREVSYMESVGYAESEARSKLHYKKSDEKVVILTYSDMTNSREEGSVDHSLPNWKLWKVYFFN